jgi:hypothetical protein
MGIIDKLVSRNAYPVVFIGSGIPKRYVKNFPNWNGLIYHLWKKAFSLDNENDFYQFMNFLRSKILEENPLFDEQEVSYSLNILASSEIEENFNKRFIAGEILLEKYGAKEYFDQRISPMKVEIARFFSDYELIPEMGEEFEAFKKFLNKTKIILTTNYDDLIEKTLTSYSTDSKLDIFIGQRGFLKDTTGWAELYKVHGSTNKPESIVITRRDYQIFDQNSVLISSKIITSLIESPIIFLGYSLTDVNIRKIIKDFAGSIDREDMTTGSDRIILVEHKKNEELIIEKTMIDQGLKIDMTVLQTDNYKLLFEKLSAIDEGLSASFINRYQSLLKKLIVEKGKEGVLQTLLISPIEMSELENNQQLRNNAAVVLADSSIVFAYPDAVTYFINYFSEEKTINAEIALRYIASQATTTRLPFYHYVNHINLDKTSLPSYIKDKIISRMAKFDSLDKVKRSVPRNNKIIKKSFSEIYAEKFVSKKEIDVVSYNIEILNLEEVKEYIIRKLLTVKSQNEFVLSTEIRRLSLCYDLIAVKE